MVASDNFIFGCEFQGNPPYYFHSKSPYPNNIMTDNPIAAGTQVGKGQSFRAHYDSTIAANMPSRPNSCYRNDVYSSNKGFALSRVSGAIADALTWMGGNVSVSIEILCRWESGDSCGDVPWCRCNADSFRFYTNRYQGFKSQWYVMDNATSTLRSIQEAVAGATGAWHHYVCQVQAGDAITPGVFKIYRDGVQSASANWTYGDLKTPTSFGGWFTDSNCYQAWGVDGAKLAFVRYYNTLIDVTELYNSGTWREPSYVNPNYREAQIKIDCNGSTGSGICYQVNC